MTFFCKKILSIQKKAVPLQQKRYLTYSRLELFHKCEMRDKDTKKILITQIKLQNYEKNSFSSKS